MRRVSWFKICICTWFEVWTIFCNFLL
jgi:hypothetical protein